MKKTPTEPKTDKKIETAVSPRVQALLASAGMAAATAIVLAGPKLPPGLGE